MSGLWDELPDSAKEGLRTRAEEQVLGSVPGGDALENLLKPEGGDDKPEHDAAPQDDSSGEDSDVGAS